MLRITDIFTVKDWVEFCPVNQDMLANLCSEDVVAQTTMPRETVRRLVVMLYKSLSDHEFMSHRGNKQPCDEIRYVCLTTVNVRHGIVMNGIGVYFTDTEASLLLGFLSNWMTETS